MEFVLTEKQKEGIVNIIYITTITAIILTIATMFILPSSIWNIIFMITSLLAITYACYYILYSIIVGIIYTKWYVTSRVINGHPPNGLDFIKKKLHSGILSKYLDLSIDDNNELCLHMILELLLGTLLFMSIPIWPLIIIIIIYKYSITLLTNIPTKEEE